MDGWIGLLENHYTTKFCRNPIGDRRVPEAGDIGPKQVGLLTIHAQMGVDFTPADQGRSDPAPAEAAD